MKNKKSYLKAVIAELTPTFGGLTEGADATWFAYGVFYGRHDEDKIRVKLKASVINKACDLAMAGDDDGLEDLTEELGFNKEHAINTMWEDYKPTQIKKKIAHGTPFNAQAEEFVFGYGPTAAQAKNQYLALDDADHDQFED